MMDDRAFETALMEIRTDRLQGASELARRCLGLLAQSAHAAPASECSELFSMRELRCDRLTAARPSIAPIQNLLMEWRFSLSQLDARSLPALHSAAADSARDGIQQSKRAVERVVEHAADYIGTGKTIITHSLSSTVLGVLERLKD